MKIIITESQCRIINEALGVPDNILDAAEKLFEIVSKDIQTINTKQEEYNFEGDLDIELGYNKKIIIDHYELSVEVKEFDEYNGEPDVLSMGMGQTFRFDRKIMMKKVKPSTNAALVITFAVSPYWEPNQLYEIYLH
jgi:hypothetical protein